ncbi:MAG TPA: tRNA-dihydrouridine synthase family protein [Candidatus Paceibacterota bacterium]
MSNQFWHNLKEKHGFLYVAAPMADVTDVAEREMLAKYSRMGETGSKLHALWTEFVAADGLIHPQGRVSLLRDLEYTERQRPLIAQLFSSNPEKIKEAARMVAELGYDGIDINAGCPDDTICKQGAGSALIKNVETLALLIEACREGAPHLPISIKTRIGWNSYDEAYIKRVISLKPDILTIHARTKNEMSKPEPHWDVLKQIVELAHAEGVLVLANGNVTSFEKAEEVRLATGCDGVMIGKGIFGKPWLFDPEETMKPKNIEELIALCKEHVELYMKSVGTLRSAVYEFGSETLAIEGGEIKPKAFALMAKHFKAYFADFPEYAELKQQLVMSRSYEECMSILNSIK